MIKRIVNQANPKMTYLSGRVENECNTVPFDIALITLLNFMSEEELVQHLNNLLKNKIQIVNEEEK